MPRKKLYRTNEFPYHITARVNNREDFPLGAERTWALLGHECLQLSLVFGLRVHALVMMPNHIHLLATVTEADLGKIMNYLMSGLTRTSNKLSGRSGHLFGGPYHWSLIQSSRYFGHALKYVYRNPVKGKLCQSVENYPYSTLRHLLGYEQPLFPIHYTEMGLELHLPKPLSVEWLEWLNRPFPNEIEHLIKVGLYKKCFERPVDRTSRRPITTLDELL